MSKININVYNTVGNSLCVDTEDGQKVYELIKKAIELDRKITLSFENIDLITSAFLNTAIG